MGTPIGRTKPKTREEEEQEERKARIQEMRRREAESEARNAQYEREVKRDRELGKEADKYEYLNQRLDYYTAKGYTQEQAISFAKQDWESKSFMDQFAQREYETYQEEIKNTRRHH